MSIDEFRIAVTPKIDTEDFDGAYAAYVTILLPLIKRLLAPDSFSHISKLPFDDMQNV